LIFPLTSAELALESILKSTLIKAHIENKSNFDDILLKSSLCVLYQVFFADRYRHPHYRLVGNHDHFIIYCVMEKIFTGFKLGKYPELLKDNMVLNFFSHFPQLLTQNFHSNLLPRGSLKTDLKEVTHLYIDGSNIVFTYKTEFHGRNVDIFTNCFPQKENLLQIMVLFDDYQPVNEIVYTSPSGTSHSLSVLVARPAFRNSDDLLVIWAQQLSFLHFLKFDSKCLFVTSDEALSDRIRKVGGDVISIEIFMSQFDFTRTSGSIDSSEHCFKIKTK